MTVYVNLASGGPCLGSRQPVAVPVRQLLDVVVWIPITVRFEVDAAITVAVGRYVLHVFRLRPNCLLVRLWASGPSWVSGFLGSDWKLGFGLVPAIVDDRLWCRRFALLFLMRLLRDCW
jgi:hypothetical protein